MTAIENEKCFLDEELEILNKLFAKRYTDEDKEYTQTINIHITNPPIIDDWGARYQRRYCANQYRRNVNIDFFKIDY